MADRPKALFKYERLSLLSIQNLKQQSVYFASPTQFNDPYDCTITAGIDEPTEAEIHELRSYFSKTTVLPEKVRKELSKTDSYKFRTTLVQIAKSIVAKQVETFVATNGVACFSEHRDDLLMWSHYGGSHAGFCLEFDTSAELFAKMRPVTYVEKMPQINLCEFFSRDCGQEILLQLYCTKSRAWAYEKEWRVLHNQAGTLYGYGSDALKAIHFGPKMDRQTKEIILLIMQGQTPDVQLFETEQVPDRFELKAKSFTFTSHAAAKRAIREIGPNGACLCGSGKKVKHCCSSFL